MKTSKFLEIFAILLISFGCWKIGWSSRGIAEQKNYEKIIERNSEIINSVGLVGATQSRVSDLLIKILAEKDGVDLGSSSLEMNEYIITGFPENKDEKVPPTFKQVILDLKEIDMSVDAIWMNNLEQEKSCRLILEHLQNE